MAAPYEHGSSRIKVQVVATLLPQNVPVHVDSFWTLVKFSDTKTICDVEKKILYSLNYMATKCPIELVVHDYPITPSWTYVPVSQSSFQNNTIFLPQSNVFANTTMQNLTVLLKPYTGHIPGNKETKLPKLPKPILMSYDITQYLPKSVKLIFKKQFVFMQDSVLLGDSRSEILRDGDVVIISAVCGFFNVKHNDPFKSPRCETDCAVGDSSEAEVELESNPSVALKGAEILFCDTDEESSKDLERKLSSDIKIKVDKILQSLASLKQSSNSSEKKCNILNKKSKKRKVSQEDSGAEVNSSFITETNRSNAVKKKKKRKSVCEQDKNDTIISDASNSDVLVRRRKKSKKQSSEVDSLKSMDTSDAYETHAVIQIEQTVPDSSAREENKIIDCPVGDADPIAPALSGNVSRKKKFHKQYFGVSSLLTALRSQQTTESLEDEQETPVINTQKEQQNNDNETFTPESATLNLSIPVQTIDSSQATPKRKRVRKRKNKKSNLDKSASIAEKPECLERDYTLKLPDHLMPQNSRVTFTCDSDDAAEIDQTTVFAQSTPVHDQHENSHTQKNITTSCVKSPPPQEVQHTSVANITGETNVAEISFNKAGVSIDPAEKFQTLLNQCGRMGRKFETSSSEGGGHAIIRSSRQKKNKNRANISDAVDPEGDVLTNVSIIMQQSSATETKRSTSSSCIQPISTGAGESFNNLSSQSGNTKMSSARLNPEIQEHKYVVPNVEISPLYMNYVSCKKLQGLPMKNDIIAYKILELSEDYTPGLSKFKEAQVINVDTQTGYLILEPRGGQGKKRSGRFELTFDDGKNNSNIDEDSLVTVNLADLVDTRLVSRPISKE